MALVSPIWHRYIVRLSLAESGLSVARATLLLFDKFIDEKGFAGGGLWMSIWSFCSDRWILDLVVVSICGAERSAL